MTLIRWQAQLGGAELVRLVDADPALCGTMARLLADDGLAARHYGSAREFLREDDPALPGCAVLGLRLPDMDGLALQAALRGAGNPCAVLFVGGRADVTQAVRAMKAGAVDFLGTPLDTGSFIEAVRRALACDLRERALRQERQRIQRRLAALTPRERQVLRFVVAGRLNKQIASELGVAEKTIKVHRARVMEKMAARSLAQLVREMLVMEAGEGPGGGVRQAS